MRLELSSPLPLLVSKKYSSALSSNSLLFSSTELSVIRTSNGIPFQLRYCPALSKKPQPNRDYNDSEKKPIKKPDPFEDPSSDLLITEVPKLNPTHFLVLNKFPVIPQHFILATKAFKQQTDFLEEDDLAISYACLKAWEEQTAADSQPSNKRLFAFFNSGEHSGASQPHRHLQFLPLEQMQCEGWTLLMDLLTKSWTDKDSGYTYLSNPSLPFSHLAISIPKSPSPSDLHNRYLALYRVAVRAFDSQKGPSLATDTTGTGPSTLSYNLSMTTTCMALCARRAEDSPLSKSGNSEDNIELDPVALNGTMLGGTLMVKTEAQWEELNSHQEKLDGILRTVGIPSFDEGSES
ncbi:MAG: bifunctional AP-4-A phosphorylase/ADP sulfurylase [Cirrosporium novae-zelandiae]|nr:MAG: bifunctional AP-4-A phosphorylase/ADP sulfurylase [Cirrosporium novae-zelandiae]